MMDRYLLRYFLAVIDEGNFSKAAAQCHVSQPTLSAGVAKLEASLGQKLFHRTNRRVELTQAGAALARHARRIEAEYLAAERDLQSPSATETLRLGVITTIPGSCIEDYVTQLRAVASNERVEFVEGRERDLHERLTRGRLDAALTILRPNDGRFRREPLFTEGYSLAMSANHPLAAEHVINGADLASETMIVRRHCELLPDTSRYFTARGVRPFFAARTTNDDQALRMVRAGLGITVMPDCYRAPGVVRPQLTDFPHMREIGLLFAQHADADSLLIQPAVRLLIETVKAFADS